VRGPNVMAGYWRRPDATARALDDQGWLRTSDAVRMDDEGFLFIVGRVEDAYVSSGRLVHPGVAEHLLLQHPSVAEACVLGDDAGAVAYIVLAPGATAGVADELSALCAAHLAAPARPVAFEFVISLPRNPAGKILRHQLRAARSANGLLTACPSSSGSS
jgi:fatty-acyl-CoA synthase